MAVALCAGSFLLRDPPAAEERVHLYAMRGAPSEAISQASSHHRLILRLDTSGLSGPMEAQIVDAIGTPIFSSPVSGPSPEVKLERTLSSGLYWVRINSAADGHRTLRESGLNVH
jgi:hypothetical protein